MPPLLTVPSLSVVDNIQAMLDEDGVSMGVVRYFIQPRLLPTRDIRDRSGGRR